MTGRISEITKSIYSHFAVSAEFKEKFHELKNNVKTIAIKIYHFLLDNKSLIFFIGSLVFAYYMAPKAAFDYLSYFGYSLTETFVEGISFGSSLLAIANVLKLKEITKHADDRINYLAAVSNICQVYLNTTQGLISAFATAGLIVAKTIYRSVFEIADKEVNVYVPVVNDAVPKT